MRITLRKAFLKFTAIGVFAILSLTFSTTSFATETLEQLFARVTKDIRLASVSDLGVLLERLRAETGEGAYRKTAKKEYREVSYVYRSIIETLTTLVSSEIKDLSEYGKYSNDGVEKMLLIIGELYPAPSEKLRLENVNLINKAFRELDLGLRQRSISKDGNLILHSKFVEGFVSTFRKRVPAPSKIGENDGVRFPSALKKYLAMRRDVKTFLREEKSIGDLIHLVADYFTSENSGDLENVTDLLTAITKKETFDRTETSREFLEFGLDPSSGYTLQSFEAGRSVIAALKSGIFPGAPEEKSAFSAPHFEHLHEALLEMLLSQNEIISERAREIISSAPNLLADAADFWAKSGVKHRETLPIITKAFKTAYDWTEETPVIEGYHRSLFEFYSAVNEANQDSTGLEFAFEKGYLHRHNSPHLGDLAYEKMLKKTAVDPKFLPDSCRYLNTKKLEPWYRKKTTS